MRVAIFVFLTTWVLNSTVYGAQSTFPQMTLFKSQVNCSRYFSLNGRSLPLDSDRKQDGEGLRPIFKGHTQAEQLLNEYQASIKPPNWIAVIGTLGVITAITGAVVSPHLASTQVAQKNIRYAFVGGGIVFGLSAYYLGQYKKKGNEEYLQKAISIYNDSVGKEKKIQFGIDYDPVYKQGQLTTEVKM